jgi:hypothetical protein
MTDRDENGDWRVEIGEWKVEDGDTPAARLARALMGQPGGSLSCAECQARLPRLVDAELAGLSPRQEDPEVAAHLDGCSLCEEMYVELLETASLALEGLPVEEEMPVPDLGFLTEAPPSLEMLWRTPLEAVQEVVTDAVGRLQRLVVRLRAPVPLPPLPAAGVLEAERMVEKPLLSTTLTEHGALGIEVRAVRSEEAPDVCEVHLVADSPHPDAPHPRRAILRSRDVEREAPFDPLGQARLSEVPVTALARMELIIEMESG